MARASQSLEDTRGDQTLQDPEHLQHAKHSRRHFLSRTLKRMSLSSKRSSAHPAPSAPGGGGVSEPPAAQPLASPGSQIALEEDAASAADVAAFAAAKQAHCTPTSSAHLAPRSKTRFGWLRISLNKLTGDSGLGAALADMSLRAAGRRKSSISSDSSLSSASSSCSTTSSTGQLPLVGGPRSEQRVLKLFERYADPEKPSVMSECGVELFCADLGLLPTDFEVLLVAWKLKATAMSSFTAQQLTEGFASLGIDSIKDLRALLPSFRAEVESTTSKAFKSLYLFTFRFGIEASPGAKTLGLDMALALWILVFTGKSLPIFHRWLAFLSGYSLADAHAAYRLLLHRLSHPAEAPASPAPSTPSACVEALVKWTPPPSPHSSESGSLASISELEAPEPQPQLQPVKQPPAKGVSKDCWVQFLEFALAMEDAQCSNYDSSEAWPTLIDAFVVEVQSMGR